MSLFKFFLLVFVFLSLKPENQIKNKHTADQIQACTSSSLALFIETQSLGCLPSPAIEHQLHLPWIPQIIPF